jgi:hypothetical protein
MRIQHSTLRSKALLVLLIASHTTSMCLSFGGASSLSASLLRHVSISRQASNMKQSSLILSTRHQPQVSKLQLSSNTDDQSSPQQRSKYVPPEVTEAREKANEPPYVKIADIVRYYDLDGGKEMGQVLVGKITYVSEKLGAAQDGIKEWNVEVAELEDVGNGYFAEPSSRKSKRTVLNLKALAPVIASYVRSEDAFKVPTSLNVKTGKAEPRVSHEGYTIEGYEGLTTNLVVNQQVLDDDMARYNKLKNDLLRDAAIAGLIGAVIAQATRGTEDAICYTLGAAAGAGYLFLLSLKVRTHLLVKFFINRRDRRFQFNTSSSSLRSSFRRIQLDLQMPSLGWAYQKSAFCCHFLSCLAFRLEILQRVWTTIFWRKGEYSAL